MCLRSARSRDRNIPWVRRQEAYRSLSWNIRLISKKDEEDSESFQQDYSLFHEEEECGRV